MGGRLSEAGRSQGLPFFGGKSKADKGATASPGTWAFWGLCQSRGRRPQGNKQADECKKCDNELPRPKRPPLSASKAPGPNCPHPAQWLRPSVEEAAQGLGRKAPMQATGPRPQVSQCFRKEAAGRGVLRTTNALIACFCFSHSSRGSGSELRGASHWPPPSGSQHGDPLKDVNPKGPPRPS